LDQCAVLYVKPAPREEAHVQALRALGFSVDVESDIPPAEILIRYHAIVVRPHAGCNLPNLGMRMRAKPRFSRRVLIALVGEPLATSARRDAEACGFDAIMSDECDARDLAANILRKLRPFPEYRCLLRTPNGRRKAA
jgi:hypothetical protein